MLHDPDMLRLLRWFQSQLTRVGDENYTAWCRRMIERFDDVPQVRETQYETHVRKTKEDSK